MINNEITIDELDLLMKEAECEYVKKKDMENENWHMSYTKYDDWPVWYAKYIIQKIHENH